ncbi:MAG TPA: MFS transporter [Acidimicrobiales bacterium]|nr:MFS transporter [Acidimicrobiales bacterium]
MRERLAGIRPFGPPAVARLGHTTALTAAADACVAVSLAGSLFFNLSLDAARPRIILYLAITMAPFAVVAPLIGPFVDKVRGGHRVVIAAACVGRAGMCLLLVAHVRTLLLYPEVFTILVLNKTHSVAKSALVPRLVREPEQLVRANSALSRTNVIFGAIGGTVATATLVIGDARWVLGLAAFLYGTATLTTLRIPRPAAIVPSPASRAAAVAELRAPSLLLGASSMALVRGAVGFLVFFSAFTLKSGGEPTWVFGAVAVAGGLGGFLGTFVAPALRRMLIEERLLIVALALPAAAAIIAPKDLLGIALVSVAFVTGLAANIGRQAFDSLVQRDAPDAERGRAFAGFEARLQLSWVVGALLPVLVLPNATIGLFAFGAILGIGALTYSTGSRAAVRRRWGEWAAAVSPRDLSEDDDEVPLPTQLVDTARWLGARGARRQAVVVATSALEAAGLPCPPELRDAVERARRGEEMTIEGVDDVIEAVEARLEALAADQAADAAPAGVVDQATDEVTEGSPPGRRRAGP